MPSVIALLLAVLVPHVLRAHRSHMHATRPITRTPKCFGRSPAPGIYDDYSIRSRCDRFCTDETVGVGAPREALCDKKYGDHNYPYCCSTFEYLSQALWNPRTPRCFGANSATTDQRLYSTQPWYGSPGDSSIAARCEEFCSQFQWPPPTEPTCTTRYGNHDYPYCCATYEFLSHTGDLIRRWDEKNGKAWAAGQLSWFQGF